MSFITFENVCKSFGKQQVLNNISFSINQGDFIGLIGPSGSGKTTLLKLLIQYLNQDSGNIHIPKNIKIGFTTQNNCIYNQLTVLENMQYFADICNIKYEEQKINQLLKFVELHHFKNRLSKNLSGGMLRRLDLAISLLEDPQILVLDELTAGLDPLARDLFIEKIIALKNSGRTIIMSTHLLDEIEKACNKIIFIHKGKIITQKHPQEVKKEINKHQEVSIKTHPGNYEKIIKELSKYKHTVDSYKTENTCLKLYTKNSASIIHHILHAIHNAKEHLHELDINQPDLNDFFKEVTKK